ncbi:MAG: dTMP kinase [Oscillospiraceae bacterium]
MTKKLIVIEGLDGSGKATQAELLCEGLRKPGVKVRKVSFPDYDSDSSALVKMYLSGQFGSNPSDVNAYAASSFYAVDRYASFKRDWNDDYENGVIVADRYTTSNAIHQCSKLPREQWDEYLDWLFDFEYQKLGIPSPTMVLYLKVDPAVSQRLMTERYIGDESKKDIHEKDVAYLKHCQEAAAHCAEKLGWKSIECTCHGEMRMIEDISKEIMIKISNCTEGREV